MSTEQMAPTPTFKQLARECAGIILSDHYEQNSVGYRNDLEATTKRIESVIGMACATERAAREQAEARLAEAVKLLEFAACPNCDGSGAKMVGERRLVSRDMARDAGDPSLEGSVYSEPEVEQCQWCDERKRLSSTTPPPILAEVERLRKLEANESRGVHCVFCKSTIWLREAMMTDERGTFHPVCGAINRAESADYQLQIVQHENEQLKADLLATLDKKIIGVTQQKATDEINRLTAQLQIAREALKSIAKPALGGKIQQYVAQDALAQITEKL